MRFVTSQAQICVKPDLSTMPVNRVFLGWDQPLVPAAAHWLWESYAQANPQISAQTAPTHDEEADAGPHWGRCDLSGVLIVVPVARAGRRLLEILASRAKGQLLLPPRIVTVG